MILITGATGNTGRAVVTALSRAGVPVRAMVRRQEQAGQFPPDVEVVVADMQLAESLRAAVDGAEQMLLISPLDPTLVELQTRMAQVARSAGVRRIVKVSTEIADPASESLIGRWHGLAEKAVEATGSGFFHLRPCNFMQNLDTFANDIQKSSHFSAPLATARISLVDVGDLAAVAVAVLLKPELPDGVAVVTGEDRPTYAEFARDLSVALARAIRYEPTSSELALTRFLASGMPAWKAGELIRMYHHLQDPAHTCITDVVRSFTGKPPRRFADFVKHYAAGLSAKLKRHG